MTTKTPRFHMNHPGYSIWAEVLLTLAEPLASLAVARVAPNARQEIMRRAPNASMEVRRVPNANRETRPLAVSAKRDLRHPGDVRLVLRRPVDNARLAEPQAAGNVRVGQEQPESVRWEVRPLAGANQEAAPASSR